jgi:drug/metabolite transporter (DMT)-like permease
MNDTSVATRKWHPLLALIAGSVCISFSPIFIKVANVSPDIVGFYRMLFAGFSLLVLFFLQGSMVNVALRPKLLLSLCGLFLAIDFMCWHRSIHLVGPGLSTLLVNFQVFFTAVLSYFILKEKITRLFMVAVFMAFCGLLFITGLDWNVLAPGFKLGVALGLIAAIFYSGYIMLLKESMNHSSVSGVFAMLVVSITSTVSLGAVGSATGASFVIPDAGSLFALFGVGVFSTTIGWSLISSAIKHVPATHAGLVLLLQPALAFVWDVLLFDRPTGRYEVFGIMLILSAIYIGSYRKQVSRA